MKGQEWIEQNRIFECIAGSHAYGFAGPESDEDKRGITIPPLDYVIGIKGFEQFQDSQSDRVIYGLKKFMDLAANCNPNIIELLFMPERHILFVDKYGRMLMDNANLFLSKKAKFTFSGYAVAQLKRIKMHKKWLDNAPEKPDPSKYVKTRYMVLMDRDGNNMPTKVNEYVYNNFDGAKWFESFVDPAYEADLKHYEHYKQWKKERNPKRADIEAKFHYDTKHACHLVRLLRMGKEILEQGTVFVDRRDVGDAEELKAIRNGCMTYEEVVKYAEEQDDMMEELYKTSTLPHAVNQEEIGELYKTIISDKFGIKF